MVLDLHEEVATWTRVAFLPYGPAAEELGISNCTHCEISEPKTMVIDEGGSVWIADNDKNRVVHFSSTGDYLGQARFTGAGEVRDLEVFEDDVVAVLDNGDLVRFDAQGEVVERGVARFGQRALYLYRLYSSNDGLFAHSFGTDNGRGLEGPAEVVDVGGGVLRPASGLPVSDASAVWVEHLGSGRQRWYRLASTEADGSALLRRFDIVSPRADHEKTLLADIELQGVARDCVIVSVTPLLPPWYAPVSPGTWLVTLSSDGDVLGGDRVSRPGTRSPALIVGGDGAVYRMLHQADGILIERQR